MDYLSRGRGVVYESEALTLRNRERQTNRERER